MRPFFTLLICLLSLGLSAQDSTETELIKEKISSIIESNGLKDEIILLGEQNHSISEHFQSAFHIIKHQIESNDYKLLMSESSFISSYLSLKKNHHVGLQTIMPAYKLSQEFQILRDISKNFNHVGFDIQFELSNSDIDFLANYFNVNEKEREVFLSGLNYDFSVANEFNFLIKKLKKATHDSLDARALENVLHAYNFKKWSLDKIDSWIPEYGNKRDKIMAENIKFWYNYFDDIKFIGLGASTHFAFTFNTLNNKLLNNYKSTGYYLKKYIENKSIKNPVVNFAFSSSQGWQRPATTYEREEITAHQNTIESKLNNQKEAVSILKLDNQTIESQAIEGVVLSGNFGFVWDYLIVFKNVTGVSRHKGLGKPTEFSLRKKIRILDSASMSPIPYSHIFLNTVKEGTSANQEGLFTLLRKNEYKGLEVVISSIGYESKKLNYDRLLSMDTIFLNSQSLLLNEIHIEGKLETPWALMKQVMAHTENLSLKDHLQYYNTKSKVNNGKDTLEVATLNEIVILDEESFSINIKGVKPFDSLAFTKLGFYASYPWRGLLTSHYKFLPILQEKKLKHFTFKFDTINSDFTKIRFSAESISKRVVGFSEVAQYTGFIYIHKSLPEKIVLNIIFKNTDYLNIQTHFKLIDGELTPVLVVEDSQVNKIFVRNVSNWVKSSPFSGQTLRMNHDLLSVKQSSQVFKSYNEFSSQ